MSRPIDADAMIDRLKAWDTEDKIDKALYNFTLSRINEQPTIHPIIVPCDYAKACNEATMNKVTSAVAYFDVLEELRKHGYVLVDMREVKT